MELDQVVPWGRSMDEYIAMFALSEQDLQKRILGVGDGPASFNAESQQFSRQVTSVDPLYQFSAGQIAERIEDAYPLVMQQVEIHREDFIWEHIPNPEALGQLRMQAMQRFLDDYKKAGAKPRYINASLPDLPFSDRQFDLALCSHFLFLYSDFFILQQHIEAIKELCRVAGEARIYPLVKLDNSASPHLKSVINALTQAGIQSQLKTVSYQFQKGATQMLVISRR